MSSPPPKPPTPTPTPPPFLPPSTLTLMTTLPPSSSPSPIPTPTHPIHPLFHPHAFPSLPPPLYARLTPSLRLASQLLLSPASLTWYLPVLLSHPLPTPTPTPRRASSSSSSSSTYLPPIPATRTNLNRARTALAACAAHVDFAFRDEGAWAAFASCHPRARDGARVYLDRACRAWLQRAEEADEARRMRWHVHVATLLLHEVAHAVWMVRFPPAGAAASSSGGTGGESEPLHSLAGGEVGAELGSSFEGAVFGGKMQPVNLDGACEEGLVWYAWRGEGEPVREFWGVGMEWVERVWRGEWEAGEGVGVVGVPSGLPFSEAGWRER